MNLRLKGALLSTTALLLASAVVDSASAQGRFEGFYGGLGAGFSGVETGLDIFEINDAEGYSSLNHNQNLSDIGAVFTGFAGYSMQNGNMVYGIEGDISYLTNDGHDSGQHVDSGDNAEMRSDVDWMATIRARAGMQTGMDTLVYVTAGLALGDIRRQYTVDAKGIDFDKTSTEVGTVLGAGIDHFINQNTFLRVEGLWTHFGGGSGGSSPAATSGSVTGSESLDGDATDIVTGKISVGFRF